MHGLLHIVDDVQRFGSLDQFSAFPFESNMAKIKQSVSGGPKTMQQLIKRLAEREVVLNISKPNRRHVPGTLTKMHSSGPLPAHAEEGGCKQYHRIQMANFAINCQRPADNVVILKDGSIVRVSNILEQNESGCTFIIGRKFLRVNDYYLYPEPSRITKIYEVDNLDDNNLCMTLKTYYAKRLPSLTIQRQQQLCAVYCTVSIAKQECSLSSQVLNPGFPVDLFFKGLYSPFFEILFFSPLRVH